jgi:diguanylate cyclase (GGDEF)-like protein/PAS domain S-box-containing protein
MGAPLHVLIIEDSEVDALLLVLELKHGGFEPLHERVETAEAVRAALRNNSWDIILCDYTLPDFNGLEALAIAKETKSDIPFIIISGAIGEEVAVAAMKAGAHDYIMKDKRQRLLPAVERELREAAMRRAHRQVEAALRESEGKFRLLVENAPDAIFVHVGGDLAYLNPAAVRLFGAESAEALVGTPQIDHIHPDTRAIARERMRFLYEKRKAVGVVEQKYLQVDGSVIDVEVSAVPITYEGDDGVLVFVRDITGRKRAEEGQRLSREIAERLAGELAVIAEIGRLISSTLAIGEVYERVAAEARKLIPFDRLSVSINNPCDGTQTVAHVAGLDIPGRRPGDSFPLKGTINGLLMRSRAGLLVPSADVVGLIESLPGLVTVTQSEMRSVMSVPLIVRDEVIGALHFRSQKSDEYRPEDLRLAERIGEQIAGAIANAWLYTDLKKTEYSLRESERRFRALVEQAAVGVAEIDMATGRFLTVNRRLCEMVGRAEEEMLATTFSAITHPEDLHLHEDKTALLLAGKIENYSLEKRYVRKDGAVIWVNITVSPLWKQGERPGRNMIVVEDITGRRLMQEENERRSRQLAILHETSVELTAELNLNELLHSIALRALELIGGVYCNCYLYSPEEDKMQRVATAGQELFPTEGLHKRGEGFVGYIWATGAPLVVEDYRSWPARKQEYDSFPSRALVGAPIHWGEELLGIIDIMSYAPHRYTRTDMDMLGMFATQAAIAIRNARLYNQVEQIAITDELTGLFNRRGFLQLGEREFERAVRFNRPLAALMFDLDHFKRVNDTYGHPAGDQVLRALTACFRQNTRGIDVVGRYGGEEFVLLLPETPLPEAVQIAERLRESIAALSVPVCPANDDSSADSVRITVSIGIAVVVSSIRKLSVLIELSDQAMYRAKASGRNCVVVWKEPENLNP